MNEEQKNLLQGLLNFALIVFMSHILIVMRSMSKEYTDAELASHISGSADTCILVAMAIGVPLLLTFPFHRVGKKE